MTANTSTPGPGTYEENYKKMAPQKSTSKAGFGDTKRGSLVRNESPGVGVYEDKSHVVKPRTVAYDMGKAGGRKEQKGHDAPAPGQYDVRPKAGGPAYSMNNGRKDPRVEASPGPGAYTTLDQVNKAKTPSVLMGKSQSRKDFVPKDQLTSPGPGTYEKPSGLGSKGHSFGQKRNDHRLEQSPGPGAYQPSSSFTKPSAPGRQISKTPRGNLMSKSYLENPAPGNYEVSPTRGGPQYSFAKS